MVDIPFKTPALWCRGVKGAQAQYNENLKPAQRVHKLRPQRKPWPKGGGSPALLGVAVCLM